MNEKFTLKFFEIQCCPTTISYFQNKLRKNSLSVVDYYTRMNCTLSEIHDCMLTTQKYIVRMFL